MPQGPLKQVGDYPSRSRCTPTSWSTITVSVLGETRADRAARQLSRQKGLCDSPFFWLPAASGGSTRYRSRAPQRHYSIADSSWPSSQPRIDRRSAARALKLPPHSVEAEQSRARRPAARQRRPATAIADLVADGDFYRDDHRLHLPPHRQADRASASRPTWSPSPSRSRAARTSSTTSAAWPTSARWRRTRRARANIRRYAEIVRERAVMRQLVAGRHRDRRHRATTRWARTSGSCSTRPSARCSQIAEQGARGTQGFEEIQPLLTEVVERIDTLYNRDNPSDVTGVPTGFTDLDRMTSGLQPGDLVIVAGRPSMGKTALALNIAEHVARRTPACRWRCSQHGNGRDAARACACSARSAARPAQAAHRAPARRRLEPADRRAWAS